MHASNADIVFQPIVQSYFGNKVVSHNVELRAAGTLNRSMEDALSPEDTLLASQAVPDNNPVVFAPVEIIADSADGFAGTFPNLINFDGVGADSEDDVKLFYRVTDDKGNISEFIKSGIIYITV